jgi:tripartite-type tricarboxylate transporter receptor subunit TctC
LPDVPTVAESGYAGYDVGGWYGVLGPAATPPAIVARLSSELLKITSQREVRERLAVFGLEVVGNTPAQFAEFIRTDVAKWSKLVQSIGLKTD